MNNPSDETAENLVAMAKALYRHGPNLPLNERAVLQIAVARGMRNIGMIDEDLALFSIAMAIERIVDELVMSRSSHALERIFDRTRELQEAHGLNQDEFWLAQDEPQEHRDLTREWTRVHDLLYFAAFDEYGEPNIAAIYRYDRARYDAMRERGRRQVFQQGRPN